ncbi:transposase [Victivallaceae bacterium BBE-744-WT-12]|uniref:Transposase n=1 Tax=Victivallis lenta TaxID=2606640 RepID=A0A844G166_9BACT|nr:integrase core domain-containing protein [Victivallis lenta]MST96662.1 transposase [Victivallis lenta]
MAGRRSDPYQYHSRIADRLFASSKLGTSTHLRNIPLKPHERASEQFQLESRISAGQDEKSILTHSKAKNHDQKFCSPHLSHGGDCWLTKRLPPFCPMMNSRCENFIRALKTECMDKIIFRTRKQIRLAVTEFLEYWNHYRPHEGLGGKMIQPYPQNPGGNLVEVSFLGGLLHGYKREALAA